MADRVTIQLSMANIITITLISFFGMMVVGFMASMVRQNIPQGGA
jgi:hypothetical protein